MIFKMPEGLILEEHKGMPDDHAVACNGKLYVNHAFPLVLAVSDLDTAVQMACAFARRRLNAYIDDLARKYNTPVLDIYKETGILFTR